MGKASDMHLSRRERQIMDVIYSRGRASVAEVLVGLPDPPSYSSVRALLGVLENKRHLKHVREGTRYVYLPTRPRAHAGRSALKRVLRTFYDGSVEKAVAALLNASDANLSQEELKRLTRLIDQAKSEGR